jgi:adenine-specific DNA-methyltransferase
MDNLEKRMMQSPDLNKERLEKLKELFPDLFTVEGKLNPDEITKIVEPEIIKETERFEFNWFGKSEAKREAFKPSKGTLIYDEKRSVNPDFADGNMIIEGENLETLKVLLSAYREKIKCIYIDPPYNTSNDFIYSDKWDESKEDYWEHTGITNEGIKLDTNSESSGRFHSNWLNMIYPRLLLAQQLLKKDGVIFISIDDIEVHHLRKICDDVFGAENLLAELIWDLGTGTAAGHFTRAHEYILTYTKSKQSLSNFEYKGKEDIISERAIKKISKGNPASQITFPAGIDFEGKDAIFKGEFGISEKIRVIGDDMVFKNGKLLKPVTIEAGWAMRNQILSWINDEETFDSKGQKVVRFYFDSKGRLQYEKERGFINPPSVLRKIASTRKGSAEIEELMGYKVIEFPKPVDLIYLLINYITNTTDTVLDFFAGSGTTGQAVIQKNFQEKTNRKFILVQIPELTDEKSEAFNAGYKRISDITIERNKRVIEKIEKEDSEKEPSLIKEENIPFKAGFKVYKLAKSNFPRVDFAPDPNKSDKENIKLLNQYIEEKEKSFFSKLDEKVIFDEVLLKNGFMLNYSLEKIKAFTKNKIFKAKDEFKECLICLDSEIAKQTLKELENYKDNIFICLERSLDTTMKWNLKHLLGDKLIAF